MQAQKNKAVIMKRNLNMMRLLLCLILISLQSCGQTETPVIKMETYDQYRTQHLELRDSLFILYTVKEWGEKNWYSWGVRSDMYKIRSNQVEYFIGGTFYGPDKKRILVWVGEKKPNATTIETYSDKVEVNKICPNVKDTIYSLSALICMRDNINQIWKIYPFDQQQATCYSRKEEAINVLGQYYFGQMKKHQMYRMMQSGKNKGHKKLQAYEYNLQDKDFWDKCWLFQKDTVGSYGLYPFQIKGYNYLGYKCTQKCAEPFNLPEVNYPEEILKLYK